MYSHDSRGWALRIASYNLKVVMKFGVGNTAFQSTVVIVAPVVSRKPLGAVLLADH